MPNEPINWKVLKDVSWWHWALTVPLLASHLAGYPWAMPVAIALCTIAGGYFLLQFKQLRPYPVQVRVAYLVLLLFGMLPGMNWLYWIPLVGTTAMVVFGYCPLLRLLSIARWNRREPLSRTLVWRAFWRDPYAGGLLDFHSARASGASCSLQASRPSMTCSLTNHRHSTPPTQRDEDHAHAH